MKKVGPNIKSQVNGLKHQALGSKRGSAKKCGGPGCKTCALLMEENAISINGKKVKLSEGNCKVYNLCYLALCRICNKPYTGRTVNALHKRTCGHRHAYLEVIKSAAENTLQDLDTTGDLFVLGLHLFYDHGINDPRGFDKNFRFGILDVTNPSIIEQK